MLTPVSFREGRGSEPRLSTPRVAGCHSARYWTDEEIVILREHYVTRGAAFCTTLLPARHLGSIYRKAAELGLAAARPDQRRSAIGSSLDERIEALWQVEIGRGAVARIAEALGVPRHFVSGRASILGLSRAHRKEPRWTAAEDELLKRAPLHNPDRAAAFFRAHGYTRSPTALVVRSKRLEISRRRTDVFSAGAAARLLGVDGKTVCELCSQGHIHATRRGTARLVQQGGDTWAILPGDLRRYILDDIDRLDIRRVDKHAFVALLAAERVVDAAIELVQSDAGTDELGRTAPGYEEWPAMDGLVSALNEARPRWHGQAAPVSGSRDDG